MDNVRENTPAEGFIFNGSFSASLEIAPMLKRMEKRLRAIDMNYKKEIVRKGY